MPDRDTLDGYAASLVPWALRLAGTVRDGDTTMIGALLAGVRAVPAPPRVDPLAAFTVVLAGMVDADRTAGELLGWLEPPTVVDVAELPRRAGAAEVDVAAVQDCVDGVHSGERLNPAERAEVVRRLSGEGETAAVIAAHTDINGDEVEQHLAALGRRVAA